MRTYELEPRAPFSLHLTFVGTEPAFPSVYDGRYLWRVIRTSGGELVPLRVEQVRPPDEPLLRVELLAPGVPEDATEEALRTLSRFLCVEDDLTSAYARMEADPALRPMLGPMRGMMPWTAFTPVEGLVDAIVFQQISLRAAFSIIRRLVKGLGQPVRVGKHVLYAFPRPEDIAKAGRERLRELGLSRNKADYVLSLSKSLISGQLDLEAMGKLSVEEAVKALTALRGVGRWTAELFLATGLKRWEVVPADDLGIRRAFAHLYGLERDQIRPFVARWGEDAWPIAYYMLVWCERRERVLGGSGLLYGRG